MKRILFLAALVLFLSLVTWPAFAEPFFSDVENYRVSLATGTVTKLSSVVDSATLANCDVEWQVNGGKIWWSEASVSSQTTQLDRWMTNGQTHKISVTGQTFDLNFIADTSAVSSITVTIYRP